MPLSINCVLIYQLIIVSTLVVNILCQPSYYNDPLNPFPSLNAAQRSCYDEQGKARRCVPPFENAAYLRPVEATNTCGEKYPYLTTYCVQTPNREDRVRTCDGKCRRGDHTVQYINDFHDNATQSWWQSETMYDGIEYPKTVNITLHLGKSYDVTYIRLLFNSPRPESLAIYKREDEKSDWTPFQYFSGNCLDTFNVSESREVPDSQPDKVLCSKEFSDISPLSGGNVIFSTLENRPSNKRYDQNAELQKFVAATDIKVVLVRHNTFGDEVFRDPQVLKTYYYAISDLSVGGRCKCNGHADECKTQDPNDPYSQLMCVCQHNTTGINCEKCLPLYNDQEWGVATFEDAHECQPCNCNGRAVECVFDPELLAETGNGGRCINCTGNTAGPNCERCQEGYYENNFGRCVACNCDKTGSVNTQCSRDGQCICRPGVAGDKCDRCADNYYDFSAQGCKPCDCNVPGSLNNTAQCHPITGECLCKQNVEGRTCEKCKPGYFNLEGTNEFGCLSCFCFGHSSVCESAEDYSGHTIESLFYKDSEKWTAIDVSGRQVNIIHNASDHSIGVKAGYGLDSIYLIAPHVFLGDQRFSYNQNLKFNLWISDDSPASQFADIIIEGAGLTLAQPIHGQGNKLPNRNSQSYSFRLHEDGQFGWSPRLSGKDFISVLANLTAIKIRVVYSYGGSGYVDEIGLESAQRGSYGKSASWVERCECPAGYDGQFCESCKTGYRHDPPSGGSFAICLPCQCNGYADFCDPYTGKCMCTNNTGGINCESCARGYYGNPLDGTGCTPCPCHRNAGACIVLPDESIACLECPQGYGGALCESCIDGYFGDPIRNISCKRCDCSGNIDENAVGNCDHETGKCLKCIHNTGGDRCERCLPGFFGDALSYPKGDCKSCGCHKTGTLMVKDESGKDLALCDAQGGQCECKPNVMGRQCDQCIEGYWDISGENGCKSCNCNIIGSFNRTCDQFTGKCYCRPGIMGTKCDQCEPYHYGFSEKGCQKCDCDRTGSKSLQCRENGQCECLANVEGRRCERCRENKFNRTAGCIDCPACYGLIQDSVNGHRSKLNQLRLLLEEIQNSPAEVEDKKFETQLQELIERTEKLVLDARRMGSDGRNLVGSLSTLRNRLGRVKELTALVDGRMEGLNNLINFGKQNMTLTENIIDRAESILSDAKKMFESEGRPALERARDRFRRYGQQSSKMSEISLDAMRISNAVVENADSIDRLSREALNNSEEAQRLVMKAMEMHSSNREEIRVIQKQLVDINDLLERTRKMAEEAKKEADRAAKDSLQLLTEAGSLSIPNVNAAAMKQDAKELVEQARRIMKEADSLLSRYENVLNGTQIQMEDVRALLKEAERQQNIASNLLSEVDLAHKTAEKAAEAANSTLTEATGTLETLRRFDESVQESRGRAQEALKRVPQIEKLINEGTSKTREAYDALTGAYNDAINAKSIAIEARDIANNASSDANDIRGEAGKTKERAERMKGEVESLNRALGETEGRLNSYADQTFNDEKLALEALERANQAKTSASEAKNKVSGALDTVNLIIKTLDGLDSVDGGNMQDLELKLREAEKELLASDLNNRTDELRKSRDDLSGMLTNYREELELLRVDVLNIRDIAYTIPSECLRRSKLEP
ncbi:laminin subunit gamma-1-like [Tetranychus urticae]|uniref:laminin subunit gamma-1-like n=1 Tax=Tetranychus urticae TaxID=32264 RepID=UPI00077BC2F9|nr:laminin subunit gamma-1-like [Tetranychus urticae]